MVIGTVNGRKVTYNNGTISIYGTEVKIYNVPEGKEVEVAKRNLANFKEK